MGGALSFTRKSKDLLCRNRVFRLPCGYMSQQWGVPFALCFTRKSEDLLPPLPILHRGPFLVEDSRWGGCWRVGFPCGLFPPVWCFPPRCLGAAPLRFFCHAWLLPFCDVFSLLCHPGVWPTSRPTTQPIPCSLRGTSPNPHTIHRPPPAFSPTRSAALWCPLPCVFSASSCPPPPPSHLSGARTHPRPPT